MWDSRDYRKEEDTYRTTANVMLHRIFFLSQKARMEFCFHLTKFRKEKIKIHFHTRLWKMLIIVNWKNLKSLPRHFTMKRMVHGKEAAQAGFHQSWHLNFGKNFRTVVWKYLKVWMLMERGHLDMMIQSFIRECNMGVAGIAFVMIKSGKKKWDRSWKRKPFMTEVSFLRSISEHDIMSERTTYSNRWLEVWKKTPWLQKSIRKNIWYLRISNRGSYYDKRTTRSRYHESGRLWPDMPTLFDWCSSGRKT